MRPFSRAVSPARTLLALAALAALSAPASAVTYNWSTGSFPGDSSSPGVLGAGDTLNIVTGGTKYLNSPLSSSGTIQALDDLYFQSGNVLSSSGLFDFKADVGFYNGGYDGGFANTGIFRKSAGTGISQVAIAGFFSSGTVDTQVGTIQFSTGASFGAGSQFTGAGSTLITSGASFTGSLTSANLTLAGGTFSGSSATVNGSVAWTAGSLTGDWSVASSQQLVLAAGGTHYLNGSLSNAGTIAASGDLYFQSGNTLTNSGLYDLQGDVGLYNGGYDGSFVNSGTLRKSAGTGTSFVSIAGFSNSGTIEAQTGIINFNSGASFSAGTVFKGPGAVVISNGASFTGSFSTQANLTLAAGAFSGTGAIINGDASWISGRLDGGWTLAAGKSLALLGGGTKYLNGSFSNLGTVAASDDLYFLSGNTLTNTALYDFKGDVGLYNGGYDGNFVNSGTLRKSAGTGTSFVSIAGFSNSGTVDVQSGTIVFNANPQFADGTKFTGAGQVVVSNGGSFAGGYTTQGQLTLSGGTFTGTAAAINGNTTWNAGRLDGTWTLSAGKTLALVPGGTKYINGSVSNLGTVAATDDLYFLSGNTLTNAGLYNLQGDVGLYNGGYDGNLINNGTLRKSAGSGTSFVSIAGFVNNGLIEAQTGTINFNANPVFATGTQIAGAGQVVVSNGASFVGNFSTANNLTLSNGVFTGGGGVSPSATLAGGSVTFTAGRLDGTWNTAPGTQLNIGAGGTKYVNGAVNHQGTANATDDLYFLSGNTLSNSGVYRFNGDVGLANGGYGGNFINTGLLVKSAGTGTSDVSGIGFVNAAGGVVDVQTGTIQLPGNFVNQGTLKGVGAYATNSLTNAGHVAPGASPGTLTVSANFAQLASGTLDVELQDLAHTDLLAINGNATLDGTLALACYGACTFAVGDQIVVLDATGSLSGSFAALTLSGFATGAFTVVYDTLDSRVLVQVTQATSAAAVPEPGSWLLMALGLGGMGLRLRRRA